MTAFARFAFVTLLAATAAVGVASVAGCNSACSGGSCTTETSTQFVGTPVTAKAAWSSGQALRVDIGGGNQRFGDMTTSVRITQGSDPANVVVTFTPFESNTQDKKDVATKEMSSPDMGGNLQLTAGPDPAGSGVVVDVTRVGDHQSSLSARADIALPQGFNGVISIRTDSGKIDVTGPATIKSATTGLGDVLLDGIAVSGALTVSSDNGDIQVNVNTPTTAGDSGSVKTGLGDVTFKLPAASVAAVSATAGQQGSITITNPLPAGWGAASGNTDQSATFNNNGAQNTFTLDASGKLDGVVEIDLQ